MADILCRSCGGRFHQTTDRFRSNVMPTGDMFQLKAEYVANGWTSFPEHSGITDGGLECPGCGAPYLSGGRVRVDGDFCYICGMAVDKDVTQISATTALINWMVDPEKGIAHLLCWDKENNPDFMPSESFLSEMDRLLAEYEPEIPSVGQNQEPAPDKGEMPSAHAVDTQKLSGGDAEIKALHEAGKTPTEIAEALGLGHYMKVIHRLKAMGLK